MNTEERGVGIDAVMRDTLKDVDMKIDEARSNDLAGEIQPLLPCFVILSATSTTLPPEMAISLVS